MIKVGMEFFKALDPRREEQVTLRKALLEIPRFSITLGCLRFQRTSAGSI